MQHIRFHPRGFLACISLLASGCGPLHSPMPVRLEADQQTAIDQAWDRAFQPVDRLSSQALLDALIVSRGFESGVDTLAFRSEKHCAAGLVAMEIQFDRLRPDADRFIITLQDRGGRIIRQHSYVRDDVANTCRALYEEIPQLEAMEQSSNLDAAQLQRLTELRQRLAACQDVLPQFDGKSSGQP